MILSMVCFALADTFVKIMSAVISPAQEMFFLIGGGLIIFFLMALLGGERLRDARAFSPVIILRYIAEILGMVGMVLALANVPLSTVGAITQATPMLVVLGAVIFLGERVSWRRWTSIGLGFIGVLMIVRPGAAGFDSAVLWAVLAMVALSVRDLTTRLTPPDMASSALATFTMIAAIPFATGWVLWNGETLFPTGINWLSVAAMIGLGSLGYFLLITSIRMAEVSIVTPFRYSRIIFLLLLGVFIFDERPDIWTLLGATIVIVSGVYIMMRERQLKRLKELEGMGE